MRRPPTKAKTRKRTFALKPVKRKKRAVTEDVKGKVAKLPAAPKKLPENVGAMGVRETIPDGAKRGRYGRNVGSSRTISATDWEHELIESNPALHDLKITAKSNSAAAHGYTYASDASLYNVFDEMVDRDPVIASCMELKVAYMLMRTHGLELDPKTKDDARSVPIMQFIQERLCDHEHFNYLLWVLGTGTSQHGRSNVELTYKVADDLYFVPDWFYHCHPGQFAYDRRGNMYLANTSPGTVGAPKQVTPRKFICGLNPALYDNPFGQSDLLRLRFYYYYKKEGWKSCVRVADKNGVPIIQVSVPADAPDADALEKDLKAAFENFFEDDVLITKAGETVDIHDRASAAGARLYEIIQDRIDRVIVRYILGAELASTVTERGARSLGEVHERTVLTRVLPLARHVERAINCLIRWLVDWNFGADAPQPIYSFDTDEKTDIKEALEILMKAKALGIPVAVRQAREWLGLDAPAPDEEIISIGDLGVNSDGNITTVKTQGSQRSDRVNPKEQQKDVPKADTSATAAAGAKVYDIYASDPAANRQLGESMFCDTTVAGQVFREMFADTARSREATLSERLEAIGSSAADDSASGLRLCMDSVREALASQHKDNKVSSSLRFSIDSKPVFDASEPATKHALFSTALLSLGATAQSLASVGVKTASAKQFAASDENVLDQMPEGFRDAAAWMAERKIVTAAALESMARAIADTLGRSDLANIERELRREIFILAKSATKSATEKVQTLITDAVKEGKTVGEFLEEIDEAFADSKLPGGLDAYWRMVYRTEVTNAYSHQQEQNEKRHEFRAHQWGHEMYNPADKRSRPTHARVKGRRFKLGSRASQLLGSPPFSFSCRCSKFALMAINPNATEYTESADAYSVAANIQRFSRANEKDAVCVYCSGAEELEEVA